MAINSREGLKKNFEKGAIPTQNDFEDLIDSMFHKQDDGLISQDDGLSLSPKGSSSKFITFFNNLNDFKPTWSIEPYPKNVPAFGINICDKQGESKLFIQNNGYIGVGTTHPSEKLTVNGNIRMHGRQGTYTSGQVAGDGHWHNITPELNACHAFEVIAKIGKQGHGLYAMTHAIALSTFGRSNNTIHKTKAYYGSFRNKIDLRWVGDTFNYTLQIRTNQDYGEESMIKYYVTNLWWEDEEQLPEHA
ncbi:adhesin [Candidatus Cardinium hertigii]|uniref:Adhesin n=1 Tax=Candidatus Cardinium hertigii TaxID=247481 RepID=A0A3N2QDE1_9BACT|nr:adhesin [Candidatus Cardinium hertigii]ROT47679.1 adhesin [Candidatus Cardinium hertigii]